LMVASDGSNSWGVSKRTAWESGGMSECKSKKNEGNPNGLQDCKLNDRTASTKLDDRVNQTGRKRGFVSHRARPYTSPPSSPSLPRLHLHCALDVEFQSSSVCLLSLASRVSPSHVPPSNIIGKPALSPVRLRRGKQGSTWSKNRLISCGVTPQWSNTNGLLLLGCCKLFPAPNGRAALSPLPHPPPAKKWEKPPPNRRPLVTTVFHRGKRTSVDRTVHGYCHLAPDSPSVPAWVTFGCIAHPANAATLHDEVTMHATTWNVRDGAMQTPNGSVSMDRYCGR